MVSRYNSFLVLFLVLLVSGGCGSEGEGPETEKELTTGGPCPDCTADPAGTAHAFVSEWGISAGDTIFLPLLEKTTDMEDSEKTFPHTITLPAVLNRVAYKYDFTVDWGDGSTSRVTSFDDPDNKHTYEKGGVYTVRVTGLMESMRGPRYKDEIDISNKLISVSDLGDVGWKALFHTFSESFSLNAVSGGDTSEVEVMAGVFAKSAFLDPDVSDWDTSKVVVMHEFFAKAYNTDPDVSEWNTANVAYMSRMFKQAKKAQPDISNWSFAKIEYMTEMFAGHTLTSANYASLLTRIRATATDVSGVILDAGKSDTDDSAAIAAKTYLTGASPQGREWVFPPRTGEGTG